MSHWTEADRGLEVWTEGTGSAFPLRPRPQRPPLGLCRFSPSARLFVRDWLAETWVVGASESRWPSGKFVGRAPSRQPCACVPVEIRGRGQRPAGPYRQVFFDPSLDVSNLYLNSPSAYQRLMA